VIHLDGMDGWMKQMWQYDGEEGADVGEWMEFCGDGGMEYSNIVRWMEKRE